VHTQYQITEKPLGKGSYAEVKLGVDKGSGKRVAIKIVDRTKLSVEDDKAMVDEVRLMQKLDHDGVVRCLDFFVESKRYFLVMELVEGGELFERIVKKSTFNEQEARNAVRALLSAIKYCHDNDIVHR